MAGTTPAVEPVIWNTARNLFDIFNGLIFQIIEIRNTSGYEKNLATQKVAA